MSELSYQMIRSANQAREAAFIVKFGQLYNNTELVNGQYNIAHALLPQTDFSSIIQWINKTEQENHIYSDNNKIIEYNLQDEQRNEQRKRSVLVLVMHYLSEQGYVESAGVLSKETNLDMTRYDVCDNIDLETVLMEYESYYFVRFQKYPKIIKKLSESGRNASGLRKGPNPKVSSNKTTPITNGLPKSSSTPALPKIPPQRSASPGSNSRPRSRQGSTVSNTSKKSDAKQTPLEDDLLNGLVIQGSNQPALETLNKKKGHKAGPIIDFRAMINDATRLNVEEGQDDRLLKPLGGYLGYSNEWRELAQVISRDIFSSDPNVRWDDIIGLDNAKRIMKEAVVYPIKYPQLFTGILSPWKGLLLYGPPGTGKTLLAKAVATECNTTFFNISASSIVSKWRGDSEKLVRVLFELARFHAPSTIFLDELESLMSQRGSTGGGTEHEGSRRMKTELLVQMDGLAKTDDLVFLLAASNLPWELDHAMLRRLEKRILVDLPTEEAREAMFKHHLPPLITPESHGLELSADVDYRLLAKETQGYSGSDIRLVAKEAAMRPVRKVFEILEHLTESDDLHIKLDPVTTGDVKAAIAHTKPSARLLTEKYKKWQQEYESV